MMRRVNILYSFTLLFAGQNSLAVTYPLPLEDNRLVGRSLTVAIPDHSTQPLETSAVQCEQGLSNMLEANPGADVFLPKPGSQLTVPQQLILPAAVRKGIVVNVAEMRLYYYPPDSSTVGVFPTGIGQAGRETPRSWVTTAERRQEAPTQTPTPSTRRKCAKREESLPTFAPAGSDNPMGLYVIYIGKLYAIHGISANFGIGPHVSQGCTRLHNDDIKYLFDNVPVGIRVQIIDQSVKYTTEPDGSRWLGIHEPLSRNHTEYESDRKVSSPITPSLRAFVSGREVDVNRADVALQRRSGMPVQISSGSRQMF